MHAKCSGNLGGEKGAAEMPALPWNAKEGLCKEGGVRLPTRHKLCVHPDPVVLKDLHQVAASGHGCIMAV